MSDVKIEYVEGEPNGLSYTLEKLENAVFLLATGWGSLRGRLYDASIEIVVLTASDFPDDLSQEWRDLWRDLTRCKMKYRSVIKDGKIVEEPVGLVASTVGYVRKRTCVDLARRICLLEATVRERHDVTTQG